MRVFLYGFFLAVVALRVAADLTECAPELITFAYTECDKDGGRWRVAVPRNNDCKISKPPAPIRGKSCDFSCEKGEYLDLSTQECRSCPVGTYSLGSGIRFDYWDELPEGFILSATSVTFAQYGYHSRSGNCSGSVWKPQKDYISSNDDDCSSSLSYSVEVKSKGSVTFKYQYADEDIIFHFYIQNSQCQTMQGKGQNIFLNSTGTSWSVYKADLGVGTNVLYWKTTGILLNNKDRVSPVLIKDIEITGVSYTTHCHKCRAGFYADEEKSQWCNPCPENTMSGVGVNKCTACDTNTQYAPRTSPECIPRPPCTEKNYFETHSSCDENKKTQVMYKWMEPLVCNKNDAASVKLPESGITRDCSPCNPGFAPEASGTCTPCKSALFSDGKEECKQCPASTAPVYGFNYIWWDVLPRNMNVSCLTVHADGCVGKDGWHPKGGMMESSQGQVPNAFLILILHIHGFRAPTIKSDGEIEYGRITFAFELLCEDNCVMYLMQEIHNEGTHVIDSWHGNKAKETYSYTITKNMTGTFTWAFQKTSVNNEHVRGLVKDDKAKVFIINVTNAVTAPAVGCRSCAAGVNENGCIPCPAGHFVDVKTKECRSCPSGTYITTETIHENKCHQCGNGTKSNVEHTACSNDCTFTSIYGRKYDFSSMSKSQVAFTPPSFTNSGRKYIHYYNFSLCGNSGFGQAECIDNVSMSRDLVSKEPSKKVKSMVCRSTKLSGMSVTGEEVTVFSQPQDISSKLAQIYQIGLNETEDNPIFPLMNDQRYADVVYVYESSDPSSGCPGGIKTHVHLRCDSQVEEEKVKIEMPMSCPDGTCDGCKYDFLWKSLGACPTCTPDDYNSIESGCVDGYITTKYIWKTYPKSCNGGVKLPDYTKASCMDLRLYIEIGVLGGTVLLVILCMVMCCLYKKSKKLEYKYQKLVMSSGKNGGELPAADSCALSDSESDGGMDQNEEVMFQKKKARILGKNKTNNYESVSLKPMQHNVV